MSVSYDLFTGAFLAKISEFEFLQLPTAYRTDLIDGYMKRAVAEFKHICVYDLMNAMNDETREFTINIEDDDIDEIVNIVSEGMVVQWLKPYIYRQELLENSLNTKDFTTYSPAELLMRVGNAYKDSQKDYLQMTREYSYNHGDLTDLHI